jgi:predicted DsbA family dithiol-disulfide isomerase
VARHIEDLSESARRLGVSSTPTFLIGRQDGPEVLLTRRINGAQPIEVYRAALDSALRDVSQ